MFEENNSILENSAIFGRYRNKIVIIEQFSFVVF